MREGGGEEERGVGVKRGERGRSEEETGWGGERGGSGEEGGESR